METLLANDRHDLYVTLPSVVADLLPKFERIYRATGNGLVRNERGYSDFNRLGASACTLHPAAQRTPRSIPPHSAHMERARALRLRGARRVRVRVVVMLIRTVVMLMRA